MDRKFGKKHRKFLLENHPRGQQILDEHDQYWAVVESEDHDPVNEEGTEEEGEETPTPTSSQESGQTWEGDELDPAILAVPDEDSDEEDPGEDPYNEWDSAELRKECKARDLATNGTKSQLVARLEKYDREHPEEG